MRRAFLALSVLPGMLSGCVERTLMLRTDPPQAEVWVDGRHRGTTPVAVPFESYGTREVVARKPGHVPARVEVELSPPWWQLPPFDLFTDLLWPGTIEDRHEPPPLQLERREAPVESAEEVAARARRFAAEGARRE